MKKIVGVLLILVSLFLGYIGFDKVVKSDASVEFIGVEIKASDRAEKQQGYLIIGLAVLVLVGGIYTINNK